MWSKEERLTLKAEEPAIAEKEAMKVCLTAAVLVLILGSGYGNN